MINLIAEPPLPQANSCLSALGASGRCGGLSRDIPRKKAPTTMHRGFELGIMSVRGFFCKCELWKNCLKPKWRPSSPLPLNEKAGRARFTPFRRVKESNANNEEGNRGAGTAAIYTVRVCFAWGAVGRDPIRCGWHPTIWQAGRRARVTRRRACPRCGL